MSLGGKLKSLSEVAKPKGQESVIIELTENSVKLVYGKTSTGILYAGSKQFAENSDAGIKGFISDFFQKLKIKKKEVNLMISSNTFISKNVDIPSNNEEEIRKIIDLQAGRYTPYSRDEIVIDCFCAESPEQHYTNVLLIIAHRKFIERCYELIEGAGGEIVKIGINSESLAAVYDEMAQQTAGEGATGGIHIARDSSDFTIIDKHKMVFVRNIPIGLTQFKADREAAVKEFISELSKSIVAYQDQGVGQVIKMLFVASIPEYHELIKQGIEGAIPYIKDHETKVSFIQAKDRFQTGSEVSQMIAQATDDSFFDVFSSYEMLSLTRIDLIPKEIKIRRSFRKSGKDVIEFGILIMTVFLLISVFLLVKSYIKNEHRKKLETLNESTFEQARELEEKSTKSRAVRELLRKRGRGLHVFEKINSMIGDDIYLSRFSYDKEGAITIGGTADSMSRIFAFVTELEESNFFTDVQTKETKSRREGQKEVADFSIECTLVEGI
ncbi:MAG: hypothetical protein COV74_03305 [Candidatus Omnitrophica bacterium CG11_big_fil_rev_8_21_14_0_20_45_26]|uniref:SHS2 domain-containing protein n=1 Tax=Candidatus Abzuiibacterium crystallinum TaxID=1974748 RepID=A0A2H0LR31_9BACT|nr:MAG: hypothetical protein COV74_03305 [Candidatus Omnitrophica bacterium CG11_big_fil_rev_8_21_14_0_20_45_26]PIW64702.1 MAG: hypothetical protein COW12_05330 [Candidatus Omnitrophica bacterium CG12_big_fil_rev_8_21_14_0_65_45_16]